MKTRVSTDGKAGCEMGVTHSSCHQWASVMTATPTYMSTAERRSYCREDKSKTQNTHQDLWRWCTLVYKEGVKCWGKCWKLSYSYLPFRTAASLTGRKWCEEERKRWECNAQSESVALLNPSRQILGQNIKVGHSSFRVLCNLLFTQVAYHMALHTLCTKCIELGPHKTWSISETYKLVQLSVPVSAAVLWTLNELLSCSH
jgi:hypothetical protein